MSLASSWLSFLVCLCFDAGSKTDADKKMAIVRLGLGT